MRGRPRFRVGLSVPAVLHPDEATRLLRQRLSVLEDGLATARETLAEQDLATE